jgi:two-component sensor histidine kinase
MVGLGLAIVMLAYRVVSDSQAERRSLEDSARKQLLYDTEFIARSLDAVLRVADSAIDARAESLASGTTAGRKGLADIAIQVPEALNAYLLGLSGEVEASAWARSAPSLALPEGVLDRLRLSGGGAAAVASAPAEGGDCLAELKLLPGPGRVVAVLFGPNVLEGKTFLIKASGEEQASVLDQQGRLLERMTPSPPGARRPASRMIASESSLGSRALLVRMSMDLAPALAGWAKDFLWQTFLSLALLALSGGLLAYSLISRREAAKSQTLEKELQARELLFHEINHRVKNNLSVVQSLISLGARRAKEEPESAEATLMAASERIRSMTMLHEQLYKRRSLESVELGAYFEDLTEAISESYSTDGRVRIEVESGERILVDLNEAVPIALIVTELVTNSCKYAFPAGARGRIVVAAKAIEAIGLELRVEDDGCWTEESAPIEGFGTVLISSLVEQLGARLERSLGSAGHGMKVGLWIPDRPK